MRRRGRLRTCALLEVRDDLVVQRVAAQHLAQLFAHRPVDRLRARERLGGLGAPPCELRAAVTPAVATELRQGGDDGAVLLLFVHTPQRQLPAHVGLEVAVLAGPAPPLPLPPPPRPPPHPRPAPP